MGRRFHARGRAPCRCGRRCATPCALRAGRPPDAGRRAPAPRPPAGILQGRPPRVALHHDRPLGGGRHVPADRAQRRDRPRRPDGELAAGLPVGHMGPGDRPPRDRMLVHPPQPVARGRDRDAAIENAAPPHPGPQAGAGRSGSPRRDPRRSATAGRPTAPAPGAPRRAASRCAAWRARPRRTGWRCRGAARGEAARPARATARRRAPGRGRPTPTPPPPGASIRARSSTLTPSPARAPRGPHDERRRRLARQRLGPVADRPVPVAGAAQHGDDRRRRDVLARADAGEQRLVLDPLHRIGRVEPVLQRGELARAHRPGRGGRRRGVEQPEPGQVGQPPAAQPHPSRPQCHARGGGVMGARGLAQAPHQPRRAPGHPSHRPRYHRSHRHPASPGPRDATPCDAPPRAGRPGVPRRPAPRRRPASGS